MAPLVGSSISRRVLLRFAALGAGTVAAVALSACGGSATTVATVSSASARTSGATSAPAATTSSKAAAPAQATTATGSTSASATVSAATTAPAGSGVTLEFWTPLLSDPVAQGFLDPWVQKFNQQHPGITANMRHVAGSNNFEKYTAAMVAGSPPDSILTWSFPIVAEWAAAGQIQPMDEWASQLGVKQSDYWSWVWEMQHFHGKLWCLVQEYDTNIFVWNKALFKATGTNADAPPTQLTAVDDIAAKLDTKGGDGGIATAGFIPWLGTDFSLWLAAHGADVYDAKNGKWTFDTPQARETLTWYQGYLHRLGGIGAINTFTKPFTDKITPVGSGKVGMQTVGDWVPLTQYDRDSPSLEYGVGVIPTAPGVKPGTNTVVGSDAFVLPAGVKHPQESMQFMLYMDSAEPVLAWCVGEANVPPTPAMANDPRFLKGVPYGKVLVDMAQPELLHPFPVVATYHQVIGFLDTAVNNVLKATTTPEAALTQAQQQADQAQARFSAQKPGW